MRDKLSLGFVALLVLALVGVVAGTAVAQSTGQAVTFVGYYMDTYCGSSGNGADGSDVVNSPQDHTKMCLVACKAGGFGISLKTGDAYVYYPFDKAGSDLSVKEVLNKSKRDSGFLVSVEGVLKDGTITVRSIKEANVF